MVWMGPAGNPVRGEAREPVRGGGRGEGPGQLGVHMVPVLQAVGGSRHPGVLPPPGTIQRPAEPLPEVREDGVHHQPAAVPALEGADGNGRGVARPHGPGHLARGEVVLGPVACEIDLAVQEGDVHLPARPGPLPPVEGGEDSVRGEGPAPQVSHGRPHPDGRAARLPGEAHDAAAGLDDEVHGGPFLVGPGQAVSRHRGRDDPRVHPFQGLVTGPQALEDARAEVVENNVRPLEPVREKPGAPPRP